MLKSISSKFIIIKNNFNTKSILSDLKNVHFVSVLTFQFNFINFDQKLTKVFITNSKF